jgi:hypothetical protein
MEDYRSKSCRDGGMMQIERYNNGGGGGKNDVGPTSMHDLRSYSTSHASSVHPSSSSNNNNNNNMGKVVKMKREKNGSSTTSRSWSLNDPELQRKKRVASYKVYSAEGKMKGSFKKSFRWIKDTYTHVVYGWR